VIGGRAGPGRAGVAGGRLVRRTSPCKAGVVFTPLNTRDVTAVLTWGLGKAGAPGPAAQVPGHLDKLVIDRQFGGASGLRGLNSVAVGSPPSLLKPPTLLVTSIDGTVEEVGVLHERRESQRRQPQHSSPRSDARGDPGDADPLTIPPQGLAHSSACQARPRKLPPGQSDRYNA